MKYDKILTINIQKNIWVIWGAKSHLSKLTVAFATKEYVTENF